MISTKCGFAHLNGLKSVPFTLNLILLSMDVSVLSELVFEPAMYFTGD